MDCESRSISISTSSPALLVRKIVISPSSVFIFLPFIFLITSPGIAPALPIANTSPPGP